MLPTQPWISRRHSLWAALACLVLASAWWQPALADDKPKAVVITGYNQDANDKAWHDKIAAEAKKDLEAAGYEVEVLTEADKDTALAKIKDPKTSALVVIDHGGTGEEKIGMKKADGTLQTILGSDLSGPFDNIKVATLHACDQDQKSWKDKFPKADFHSWSGCVFPSTELEWQQKKEYAKAEKPQTLQTSIDMHHLLEDGQFIDIGDGVQASPNPLSGNWLMNPALAFAFGSQTYNFFVYDNDLSNPDLLFSAQASNGAVLHAEAGQQASNTSFDVYFTDELFVEAIQDPFVLLDPGLLGTRAFIDKAAGNSTDAATLFAGVAKNIFNIDPTLPNGGHPLTAPSTIWLLALSALLGLLGPMLPAWRAVASVPDLRSGSPTRA